VTRKRRQIVLTEGPIRQVWRNGARGEVDVDLFREDEDEPYEKLTYPKTRPSLQDTAMLFKRQAILDAEAYARREKTDEG